MKEKFDYKDFVMRNSWAHSAILRAMVESLENPETIMEHFKLEGFKELEVELFVNGIPAKVSLFFEAMGAEYDAQVEQKALELLSQRFGDIQDLFTQLEDNLKRRLKAEKE